MPDLLFVRHALSTWNAEGRWQGSADPELSEVGRAQARTGGPRLAELTADCPLDLVVSSDLRRAAETADILRAAVGLAVPSRRDRNLREYDVGQWSGLTRPEIDARWPGQVDAWNGGRQDGPPGGETTDQFRRRVADAVHRLAGALGADQRVLVVAHGHFIRSVVEQSGAPSRRIANLSGQWVTATATGLRAGDPVALLDHDKPAVEAI